jgi:hypothetical protein
MGAIEEYKARNTARDARRAETKKPPGRVRWWFSQPVPIDRFTGWLVAWTALLFIATAANVLVLNHTDEKIGKQAKIATDQAKIAADQAKIMRNQLDVMEADQRPWISMVAMPKIASPLHMITNSWATVDLTFTIKNSGRLPARRVAIALKIIGFPRSGDLLGEQQRFCNRGDEPLPAGAKYAEFTIFPGDQYEVTESASALANDLVEMRASNNKRRALVAGIVGCINYQFISDERVHRTGIILNLLRKTATQETNYAIDLDTTPIQPDDLSLSFSHVGNGPAY